MLAYVLVIMLVKKSSDGGILAHDDGSNEDPTGNGHDVQRAVLGIRKDAGEDRQHEEAEHLAERGCTAVQHGVLGEELYTLLGRSCLEFVNMRRHVIGV